MSITAVVVDLKSDFNTLFSAVADEPWALFLDSCDHPNSRYDFIFRQPEQVLTDITDWPQALQSLLAQLPDYQGPSKVPFQGGLAGAFSYDAGRALEQLPNHADSDIALPDIAIGLYSQALVRCRQTHTTWLVAPAQQLAELEQFWHAQQQNDAATYNFQLTSAWQSNMTAADYQAKFNQVQDYLHSGDCYQINLAQRFKASFNGDAWAAYQYLREANKAPFSAFMRLPQGALLSHSPERFLHVSPAGSVQTKPIKGTRPRGDSEASDQALADELRSATKDRAENVMIVDLLRNDLSRVCLPSSVNVPKLFAIESYPAVHHLVSTVEGQLQANATALDLIAACFPGGSITGAPKIRAMEIIDELEPQRRSFYCGSFGYISQHGESDTNIAIRTLVASSEHIYCWAGGGLVVDSNGEEEYQETLDKVAKIVPVLAATQESSES